MYRGTPPLRVIVASVVLAGRYYDHAALLARFPLQRRTAPVSAWSYGSISFHPSYPYSSAASSTVSVRRDDDDGE